MRPLGSVVVTGAGIPAGMEVIKGLIRQSEPLSAGVQVAVSGVDTLETCGDRENTARLFRGRATLLRYWDEVLVPATAVQSR